MGEEASQSKSYVSFFQRRYRGAKITDTKKAQEKAHIDRTRIVERVLARRPLVVEMGELLELRVCQEPEVEERPGEGRVYVACRELD